MTNTTRLQTTKQKLIDGPDTPTWWPLVQIALGVGFVLYLLISLGTAGDAPAPVDDSGVTASPPTVGTDPPTVTDAPAAPSTPDPAPVTPATPAEPPAATTVQVPSADGSGPLDIEAAAKATADAAAVALFTGNFDDVVLTAGTSAPSVVDRWPDATIADVTVRPLSDSVLQFVHTIDPDADGAETARTVTVHVVRANGSWAFRGA